MLQVRKVIEHLYEKVIGQGSDGGSQTAVSASANVSSTHVDKTDREDELSSIADEKVELLCNDQVQLRAKTKDSLHITNTPL